MNRSSLKIALLLLALLPFTLLQEAWSQKGAGSKCDLNLMAANAGGDVPFPWGTEVPFPWGTISGLWAAEKGGTRTLFRFSGLRRLINREWVFDVEEVLPQTNQVVARGVGIAPEDGKIVRSMMTGDNGVAHMVIIRAYREVDEYGREKIVTVLTVRYIDGRSDVHFVLERQRGDD